jgi:hypothetical protein
LTPVAAGRIDRARQPTGKIFSKHRVCPNEIKLTSSYINVMVFKNKETDVDKDVKNSTGWQVALAARTMV